MAENIKTSGSKIDNNSTSSVLGKQCVVDGSSRLLKSTHEANTSKACVTRDLDVKCLQSYEDLMLTCRDIGLKFNHCTESLKDQEMASDDSDESVGLPSLEDIFPLSKKQENTKILVGDIVWAEYQGLHWPALVRKVDKKARRVTVWYLDSPRKCFKLPFKKLLNFNNPEVSQRVREAASQSHEKERHHEVWIRTLTYIRRKSAGYNDDPGDFFETNKRPYLLLKKTPSISSQELSEASVPALLVQLNKNCNDCSDDECIDDHDIDNSDNSDTDDKMPKYLSGFRAEKETSADLQKANEIVCFIKSGKIDKYLLAIHSGEESSVYQRIYEDAMKTDRRKLGNIHAGSVIKNYKTLVEIGEYLLNLYEKVIGNNLKMVCYVWHVWLPESIAKAVHILDDKSTILDHSTSSVEKKT